MVEGNDGLRPTKPLWWSRHGTPPSSAFRGSSSYGKRTTQRAALPGFAPERMAGAGLQGVRSSGTARVPRPALDVDDDAAGTLPLRGGLHGFVALG